MDRVAFSIGSFDVYWYGILILTGIIVGYSVARYVAKERDINMKDFDDLIFYGLIIAVIGTRLYYVIFNFESYHGNVYDMINVRDGGMAIHGGILSAFLWGAYFTRKRRMDLWSVFDAAALGFMIAQAIGRWGNFVNKEAHGGEVTKEFLDKLPIPDFVVDGMNIMGTYYQPTFFYESMLLLIGFIFAFTMRNKLFKRKGDIFCFYIIYYSTIRFFIESMRTDSLMLGSLKAAQVISIIGIILGLVLLKMKGKKS